MKNLAIIGAGSWGTALAIALAHRFDSVRLWAHHRDLAASIQDSRENHSYLSGFSIPHSVEAVSSFEAALDGAQIVLLVTPSQHMRSVLQGAVPYFNQRMLFVSASKGIETGSLQRMSEVIRSECQFPARVATLSGPTFAREVAQGEPAAVVIASPDAELNTSVQAAFSGRNLRLYTNSDQVGVEIGGSLKNVVAIGAGICKGLGLGNNTVAALVTRGLAEITRLSVAAGGQTQTLAGLAGLGDLVLTCTGDLSRNRHVGIELGKGRNLPDILASTNMVAEGVETTGAAVALAAKLDVEMPIMKQMYAVLHDRKPPRDAIRDLMERTLRSE